MIQVNILDLSDSFFGFLETAQQTRSLNTLPYNLSFHFKMQLWIRGVSPA